MELRFNTYYSQNYTDYFVFNDSVNVIVIKNAVDSDTINSNLEVIQQKLNKAGILEENNIPELNFKEQTDYYTFENYLVCFFNVNVIDLDKFESSIKSFR